MSGHDCATELEEAREILNNLRKAYKEYTAGGGMTERYKIKDHEVEFSSLVDLLKQIRFQQREIIRLGAVAGISPRRSGRIITQFQDEIWQNNRMLCRESAIFLHGCSVDGTPSRKQPAAILSERVWSGRWLCGSRKTGQRTLWHGRALTAYASVREALRAAMITCINF